MDTFILLQLRKNCGITRDIVKALALLMFVVCSPAGHATILKFEFSGIGELYDYNFNPLNTHNDMSLQMTIDISQMESPSADVNGHLKAFSFNDNIKSIVLSIDEDEYTFTNATNHLNGIAINDDLDVWENTVSVDMGVRSFIISQWIRSGIVNKETFTNSSNGVLEYYKDMMSTVNGLWRFDLSDKSQFYGGALNKFSVSMVQVPEPSSFLLLFMGFVALTYRRVKLG